MACKMWVKLWLSCVCLGVFSFLNTVYSSILTGNRLHVAVNWFVPCL